MQSIPPPLLSTAPELHSQTQCLRMSFRGDHTDLYPFDLAPEPVQKGLQPLGSCTDCAAYLSTLEEFRSDFCLQTKTFHAQVSSLPISSNYNQLFCQLSCNTSCIRASLGQTRALQPTKVIM